jgi:hypothetical protein
MTPQTGFQEVEAGLNVGVHNLAAEWLEQK